MDVMRTVRAQADRADAALQTAQKPLPVFDVLQVCKVSFLEMRDALRALYVEHTGEDPWSPCPESFRGVGTDLLDESTADHPKEDS